MNSTQWIDRLSLRGYGRIAWCPTLVSLLPTHGGHAGALPQRRAIRGGSTGRPRRGSCWVYVTAMAAAMGWLPPAWGASGLANAEVYPGPPWRLRAAANKEHTAVRVGVQAGLRVRNGGLLDVAVTDANQSNKAHVPVSLEGREPTNARSQGVDQEATHSADGSMPGLAHAPEHTFRVLYVNSYHPGNAWSDQIYVGITEVLSESFGQRVDVSVEYLDGKRYPAALETSLGDRVLAVWEEKYRNCRIDLLLVSDQDAYDLMRRARSSLFPSVPLVFAGVEEPGELDAHTAGVLASTDIRANIEMILQVYPNVQRIWSVTDDSLTGRRNRRGVAALVESFSDRVKLEFFDTGGGIEPRELLSRAEKLGAGDAILFLDVLVIYFVVAQIINGLFRLAEWRVNRRFQRARRAVALPSEAGLALEATK